MKKEKYIKKIIVLLIIVLFSNNIYCATNIKGSEYIGEAIKQFNDKKKKSTKSNTNLKENKNSINNQKEEIANNKKNISTNSNLSKPRKMIFNQTDFFGENVNSFPIFRVDVSKDEHKKNYMCLTFDCAYINKYTNKLLDVLDEYNIKSTFFMTYEYASKYKDQVKEIIARGHEIGNHSSTHPDFNKTSNEKIINEITKFHMFALENFGVDMYLFRYPYGSYSERTLNIIKNLGYYPIQWTVDSVDWKNEGVDAILTRINNNIDKLKGGSIILFHNGAEFTTEALPEIVKILRDKGLEFVKVSDLIHEKDFYLKNAVQFKK